MLSLPPQKFVWLRRCCCLLLIRQSPYSGCRAGTCRCGRPVIRMGYPCVTHNCRSSVLWSNVQHWEHCPTYAVVTGPEDPTQLNSAQFGIVCIQGNPAEIQPKTLKCDRPAHDRSRGLCYHPAVFCRHRRVIARSYPESKIRCAFKNVI
jgi:hypothetical protein